MTETNKNLLSVKLFVSESYLANTYLVTTPESVKAHSALIIDTNQNEQAFDYLRQMEIDKVILLLTHEHFDHTYGVNKLKDNFDCTLICQNICAKKIADKRNNRSLSLMNVGRQKEVVTKSKPYECFADVTFDDKYLFKWFNEQIVMIHTPGHSEGSCCIEIDNNYFVGDVMLKNLAPITRFPGGNEQQLASITIPYLKSIRDDGMIYPGHGEPFLKSEVVYNNGRFINK